MIALDNNPLISIITVVYNAVNSLECTIQSVLGQSYPNIEYLIIDGGSTDGSVEIIKKYSNKLTYWVSEKDHGIYDAMNKGLKLAKGELIGIINSDDWYELDAVEQIVKSYKKNCDTEVFHGLLRFVDHNGNFKSIAGHDISFINTGMIEHPTCFVKSALYQKLGYFDNRYRAAADYDFMNRAVSNKVKFSFINHIIANFSEGGITSSETSAQEELKIKYKYGHISRSKFLRWLLILKIIYLTKK